MTSVQSGGSDQSVVSNPQEAQRPEHRDDGPDSAPVSVTPPPGHPRFPLIDGLRALAALSIILLHSRGAVGDGSWWVAYWSNLSWGVAVFFVISGFLLYRPFVAASAGQAPPVGARDFYRRRVLRILPGYWVALTVVAVVFGLPEVFGRHWWQLYGLLQAYNPSIFRDGLIVTWSLSIEAGLYLVLPAFAVGSVRIGGGRSRSWVSALAATTLVSVAALVVAHGALGPISPIATAVLNGATWFGLGMMLASLSVGSSSSGTAGTPFSLSRRFPEGCWLLALALFLIAGFEASRLGAWLYVLEGAAAVLIVLPAITTGHSMRAPGGWVRTILAHRAVAWLGLVSYGLYIWHWPVFAFLLHDGNQEPFWPRALAAWILSFGLAMASYLLLEQRYMSTREIPRNA